MKIKYDKILGELRESDEFAGTGKYLGGISGGATLNIVDGGYYYRLLTTNTAIAVTLGNQTGTIELRFKCTTGLPTIVFTNTVLWGDSAGVFRAGNPAPLMNQLNRIYCIAIRYDGERYLGNLAYTVEL